MQYSTSFATSFASGTAKASSTTAETFFSVLATSLHQPRRAIDAPEWDPSRDEIVQPTAPGRWGAVGGELLASRDSAARPQTISTPGRWGLAHFQPTVKHGLPAPDAPGAAAWWASLVPLKHYAPIDRKKLREEAYQLTESFNPFNPSNIAAGENRLQEEAKAAERARRCPREAMEELTEEFNPFHRLDVAVIIAAEARFASGHASAGDVNSATSVDDAGPLSHIGIHTHPSATPDAALITDRAAHPQTPPLDVRKAAATCESSPESSTSSRTTASSRFSTPQDYPATHLQEHGRRATHWSMVHALEASLKRRATVQTSPRGTLAQIGGAEKEGEYRDLSGGAGAVEFSFLDDD
ncbi:hypothetical protein VTO73DRAFT_7443 [Trametes versicolor]